MLKNSDIQFLEPESKAAQNDSALPLTSLVIGTLAMLGFVMLGVLPNGQLEASTGAVSSTQDREGLFVGSRSVWTNLLCKQTLAERLAGENKGVSSFSFCNQGR